MLQRTPHRSPWRWYRSQRRVLQVAIGGVILIVLFACIIGGVIIIRASRITPNTLNSGPTPTDTPTLPSDMPTNIPVTPLPTIVAAPGSGPIATPTPSSQPTSTTTPTGTTTPTTTPTGTTTPTTTPTGTTTPTSTATP